MRRQKHSRTSKDQEGDMYMNILTDDVPPDPYSRPRSSYHVSEPYRGPSSSTPTSYGRDTQPRSRREDDWRHRDLDHDRYSYNDAFPHAERNEYEENGSRNPSSWGPAHSSQYGQSSLEWPQQFDSVASSSSYSKPPPWGITPPAPYDHSRPSFHERWSQTDTRDIPMDDWVSEPSRNERPAERRHADWRPESRRDKNLPPKFQSDSGWESRRRDRPSWNNEPISRHDDPHEENILHTAEDRAWEPAASWKSTSSNDHHNHHQRSQNGQRSSAIRAKRGQTQAKRREWRAADDSDLNNWTRRDTVHNTKLSQSHYPPKRKHPRPPSHSRSRSRSPTDSYISRPSSRGRSHSRSISPATKRRRRDSSPVTLRSRTPSERSIHPPHTRAERYTSRSVSPTRSPGSVAGHRRSPSNASSQNSDRSPSQSPNGPVRSVHRLPPMDYVVGSSQHGTVKASSNGHPRRHDESRVPKTRPHRQRRSKDPHFFPNTDHEKFRDTQPPAHGRPSIYERPLENIPHMHNQFDHGNSPAYEQHTHTIPQIGHISPSRPTPDPTARAITIAMPPPLSIPSARDQRSRFSSSQDMPSQGNGFVQESAYNTSRSQPPRVRPLRNTGFKPIVKASSSLKKFFPGDEEDADTISEAASSRIMENNIPPAPNIQHPPVWRRAPNSVLDENTSHLQHKSIANDRPRFIPHPSSAPDSPGQAKLASDNMSAANSLQPMADYEHTSPRSMDAQPDYVPAETSHELDMISPPQSEHQEGSNGSHSSKDLYKIVSQVGEGTFGKVYKALNTATGTHVALKRIRMESERDGFPVTAMREIKLLQSLRHENVVRLYEMMVSNGSVYMVFEYMDHDLTGVLSQNQFAFTDAHLKSLCHQMLAGLAYLHHKGVIHRDIKGSNILINNRGELKLADFGLARFYHKRRRADYTNRVITLWYRPPELLFGATVYGPEVDMWSAGCIMLELYTKKPVFQGVDEIHQIEMIFKIMGSPTTENWPDVMSLPWYELVKPQQPMPNRFREAFQKWMSPAALDLAELLLTYDPMQRANALQAMNTPYFVQEAPLAARPVGLIDLEGEWHELETKRERAKRKERKTAT